MVSMMTDYEKLWNDLKNGIRRDLKRYEQSLKDRRGAQGSDYHMEGVCDISEKILKIMDAMESIG